MQTDNGRFGQERHQSVWAVAHEAFGHDQRQDITGFGAQASEDPYGTEPKRGPGEPLAVAAR
jgi:hypothetical protein